MEKLKIYILLIVFTIVIDSCTENTPKSYTSQSQKIVRTKTIILLDVSITFEDYIEKSCKKINKYIDQTKLLEDVTLRKIGTNAGDDNFIAELDLTNGFVSKLNVILSPCNQYKKSDRKNCEEEKSNIRDSLETDIKNRKTNFKDKLASISLVRDAKTDIITPINQCLRDFERTKYDKRRIIIFSDLNDETENLDSFNLDIDALDYVDEIFIFYAQENYADLWEQKLQGKNVSINHISITETSFNKFIEQ